MVTGGLKDGTQFDSDKDEFYFADTTDEYKEYLTMFHKMYEDGLIDPETFYTGYFTGTGKILSWRFLCTEYELSDFF